MKDFIRLKKKKSKTKHAKMRVQRSLPKMGRRKLPRKGRKSFWENRKREKNNAQRQKPNTAGKRGCILCFFQDSKLESFFTMRAIGICIFIFILLATGGGLLPMTACFDPIAKTGRTK
jgi:hypothetical protein